MASPVVQRLRVYASNAGGIGCIRSHVLQGATAHKKSEIKYALDGINSGLVTAEGKD